MTNPRYRSVRLLGFLAAVLTSILALISFGIAVNTMPISGPFCQADCIVYPFAEAAPWVPHDYIWMYPAILLMLATLVTFLTLHEATTASHRLYSRVAAAFVLMATVLLVADYYMQIAVLQPSLRAGETEGLALLTQYNGHGVFIALEDLGYFLLGVAFLFAAPLFARERGVGRVLFWLLLVAGLLTVSAWPVLYAMFGFGLSYRYEVAAIAIVWTTLIVAGALLGRWFWRGPAALPAGPPADYPQPTVPLATHLR